MIIKKSAEDYLESILMISKKKQYVHSVDIASELNITKPSVSVAMKNFRKEGYINMEHDGSITLTEKGMEIAARIYEKHQVIAKILIYIGVDEKTAYEDSCKIEHDLSEKSFQKIKEAFKKFEIKEKDEQ